MSAPEQQRPLVQQAVESWSRMETLIGTPLGEQAWNEHWGLVARLRRKYVLFCLGLGLFSAGAAAIAVTQLGLVWQAGDGFPFAVLPFVLAPVILGPVWKRQTAATVAPFLGQRRHVWPRWLFSLVYPVVLILGVFVPWSLASTVVAAVLCAAPWWLSAGLEARRPMPSYPEAWRTA
ncbi:hypothetical protein O4J56_05700 [Nocardiopsis sp. RSe5-2]|uniref:Uncharacterized protein n=1 Tax=Nocardiopsis endophytica TaxID=3018445 RepID=A0ABT4U0C6_9ACTN|nr:hypothetical protein [Nocardiopsis endophytica]MDA2810126.1 hypothetical protein [Nocardiopsis endophytica]